MGSLADTFGPTRDGPGTTPDEGPVLRPGPFAASGDGEVARVTTGLSLLGCVLFVAGIGIAFFSSTLLSTLAYMLLIGTGAVFAARYYLASAAAGAPPPAVVTWLEARTGSSGRRPGPLAGWLVRERRGRIGRTPPRSLSRRLRVGSTGSASLSARVRRLGRPLVEYVRVVDAPFTRRGGERL